MGKKADAFWDPDFTIGRLQEEPYIPINLEKLKIWPADPLHRRQAPRYHLRLEIYLSNDQQIFHTRTENISFTGVLLKELVPEGFSKRVFDIVIKDTSQKDVVYFVFRGKIVPDGKFRSRRIQFESMSLETESKLIDLLENLTAAG